jgi:hypothetical protein
LSDHLQQRFKYVARRDESAVFNTAAAAANAGDQKMNCQDFASPNIFTEETIVSPF